MPQRDKITVIFRIDDCSAVSPVDFEVKSIHAFQIRDLSCAFGVIPYKSKKDAHDAFSWPSKKIKILKDGIKAGILEIGLHGYSHQAAYKILGGFSEFANQDSETQLKKIERGKVCLEEIFGTRITTFIPPWNSYDPMTVDALESLGFRCISADRYGYIKKPSLLKFLPGTCGFSELRAVVESARKISDIKPILIVAVIHDYSFLEYSKRGKYKFQDLTKILDWVASQHDIRVCSFDHAVKTIDNLEAAPLINYKLIMPPLMPKFLGKALFSRFILPASMRGARIRCWIFEILFYSVAISVLIIAAAFIF